MAFSIGSLVRANSSNLIAVGVVSARVGGGGLMVSLLTSSTFPMAMTTQLNGTAIQWKSEGEICWFELKEEKALGFHHVINLS